MAHEVSKSFEIDGKEVLIPTVLDGEQLSDEDALSAFRDGRLEAIGTFDSPEAATAFAKQRSINFDPESLRDLKSPVAKTAPPASLGREDVLADIAELNKLKIRVGVGVPAVLNDAGGIGRDSPYDVAVQEMLDKYGGFDEITKALDQPPDQEFLNAAVTIAGTADGEVLMAEKLMVVHNQTGKKPIQIFEEAQEDPTIRADLLSDRTPIPRAYDKTEVDTETPIWSPGGGFFTGGLFEDIGRGVLQGVDEAVEELFITFGLKEFGDKLEEISGGPIMIEVPKTLAGQVAVPLTQGTLAMVPVASGLRALGVTSAFLRWTAAGAFADFAAFAPDDPGIANITEELGALDNEHLEAVRVVIQDALAKDIDDSDLEKRLKAAAEGAIVASTLVGLVNLFRASKALQTAVGTGAIAVALGADEAQAGGISRALTTLGKEVLTNAPALFSKATKVIDTAQTQKASGKQWLATLKNAGVKDEEIESSGLAEFLANNKAATKTEVLEFIDTHGVKLEETVLGGRDQEVTALFDERRLVTDSAHRARIEARIDEIEAMPAPKFASPDWQLPGGENYRELLIRLPDNSPAQALRKEAERRGYGDTIADWPDQEFAQLYRDNVINNATPSTFTGGHYDEPNVLAHVRYNERVDAGGNKTLFIEEIQSDWHQKGRTQGYVKPGPRGFDLLDKDQNTIRVVATEDEARAALRDVNDPARDFARTGEDYVGGAPVPDAPFKKTWPVLALKRMIRLAAEGDFDQIAWTTGAQQADRYDLSKYISTIGYEKRGELVNITVWGKDGEKVLNNQSADARWLEDNLGKEMAEKIAKGEGRPGLDAARQEVASIKYLEDLDLKVGGEGMKTFYDRMLVNNANKIGKKFGAKVQKGDVGIGGFRIVDDSGELGTAAARSAAEGMAASFARTSGSPVRIEAVMDSVHTFPITPELKDEVLNKGLPLFSAGGVGLLAADQIDASPPDMLLSDPFVPGEPPKSERELFPTEPSVAEELPEEFQVAGLDDVIRPLLKAIAKAPGRALTIKGRDDVLARISQKPIKGNRNRWDDFYTNLVDDLHPLDLGVRELTLGDVTLKVLDDPYKLARLNRGVNGKADHFLEYSPFKFHTYENVGKSLKAILAPVNERLDDVRAYMVAKRSLELQARGIETGVPADAARATVDELGGEIESVFRELVEFQEHVLNYLRDAGVLSREAVVLMRDANRDYVPFFRVMEPEGKQGVGRGLQTRQPVRRIKGSERLIVDPLESIIKNTYLFLNLADRNAVGDALLRLAESRVDGDKIAKVIKPTVRPIQLQDQEIRRLFKEFMSTTTRKTTKRTETVTGDGGLDPGASKIRPRVIEALTARGFSEGEADSMLARIISGKGNTEKIIREIETTEIVPAIDIRLPNEAAMIFRPNGLVVAPDQIAVYREGKRLLVQVDPDIADTFKALDQQGANVLVQILAVPARLLRAGAVLSPEFIARNPIRDQFSAYIFSQNGFVPFLDLSRGIFNIAGKTALYQDWIKSGGPMASLVSLDRTYLQKNIRQIAGQTTMLENVVNVVKSPVEALRILSDLAERGTRVGEFARVAGAGPAGSRTKEDILRGGFASREVTLDFARIGAKTRSVNQIIAFWNANVQGTDKLIRSLKSHPKRTLAKIAAGVTIPAITLHLINRKYHDDPDDPNGYSKLPKWVRDLHYLVWVEGDGEANGVWWRIPKLFEVGIIFATGAENTVDAILDGDPRAFDGFLETMGRGAMPGFMPTFAAPILETWANHSFFRDRPVIPARLEGMLPEYQYGNYTTESAKAVGKAIAQLPFVGDTRMASPLIIENWIRGWSGGLGMHIVNTADFALRKAGALPDPVLPARTLADIPFVKGFVVRHPTAGAENVQKLYDSLDELEAVQKTIRVLINDGDHIEALKVMERGIADGELFEVQGIREALSNSMKTVRMIHKNSSLTPDEKRQFIDTIYAQMIMMAQTGNEIIKLGREQAKAAAGLVP